MDACPGTVEHLNQRFQVGYNRRRAAMRPASGTPEDEDELAIQLRKLLSRNEAGVWDAGGPALTMRGTARMAPPQ